MKLARILAFVSLLVAMSCGGSEPAKKDEAPAPPPAPTVLKVPTGIEDMSVPADNPITPEKVELGKMLFFDKRLSKDGKMSCETCHLPEKGWTDAKPISTKADGKPNTRHSPTLYNVGFQDSWYWDGRAATLEAQIKAAWNGQMATDPDAQAMVAMTLNGIEGYKTAFQSAMGGEPTPDNIVQALASFVRTIRSEDSPWDKFEKGDKEAVSLDVRGGFEVFRTAECGLCHTPPLYTDKGFHNIGIGTKKEMPDPGRGKILADKQDPQADAMTGAFKTPTLRSVAETGPYFHDGSARTLEEAVDVLLNGGIDNPHKDAKLKGRKLNAGEKKALLTWLRALSPAPVKFEKPKLP
jgi:cytochrome c peroxidase